MFAGQTCTRLDFTISGGAKGGLAGAMAPPMLVVSLLYIYNDDCINIKIKEYTNLV